MTSILGSLSIGIAGGISLLGPANLTGEALFEKTGSVRIVSPSFLIRYVACPIQMR